MLYTQNQFSYSVGSHVPCERRNTADKHQLCDNVLPGQGYRTVKGNNRRNRRNRGMIMEMFHCPFLHHIRMMAPGPRLDPERREVSVQLTELQKDRHFFIHVEFEALTMPFRPMKISVHFEGTCSLHLQG
jgi:hypothetical protein